MPRRRREPVSLRQRALEEREERRPGALCGRRGASGGFSPLAQRRCQEGEEEDGRPAREGLSLTHSPRLLARVATGRLRRAPEKPSWSSTLPHFWCNGGASPAWAAASRVEGRSCGPFEPSLVLENRRGQEARRGYGPFPPRRTRPLGLSSREGHTRVHAQV